MNIILRMNGIADEVKMAMEELDTRVYNAIGKFGETYGAIHGLITSVPALFLAIDSDSSTVSTMITETIEDGKSSVQDSSDIF